jgi:preprotein translocase subunit SecF
LLVLRPADFFGAAALRFLAFFFGASGEAVGVIMDIMSAIIVASPVWVH